MALKRQCGSSDEAGRSLLETLTVVAIALTVMLIAIPVVLRSMQTGRVREAGTDYASLLQVARMRAVNDDRYYSVYIQSATGNNPQLAYVDIYPQNVNGASGSGSPSLGGSYTGSPNPDPMVPLSSEVTPQLLASAPNSTNLFSSFCASCATSIILDASPSQGVTFGPEGLPCIPTTASGGVGTVCNSAGGPVAYVQFFQSSTTQEWDAVTVTPAGRIQAWFYDVSGAVWNPLS